MSDADFLHTPTPAGSDAREDNHPRAAPALLELISRRLREAEARQTHP